MPSPDFSALDDARLLSAEDGLHTMFAKARDMGADTTNVITTHEELTKELRSRGLFYEPLAKADGHTFNPVRNICRNCRQPGPPAHDSADHEFVPVRNVCKDCGQGTDVHKAVGAPVEANSAKQQIDNTMAKAWQGNPKCAECGGFHAKGAKCVVDNSTSMGKSLDELEPVCKALGDQVSNFTKARIIGSPMIKAIYTADTVEAILKALPELPVEARQQMAETGIAMPDGSFPIPDEAHLHAAIRLVGQAQDPQSAMNHIIERAKAMGMKDALPPAWQTGDPAQTAGPPAVAEGAHSLQVGKPAPAQSGAVKPTPGAGLGGGAAGGGASKPGLMKRLAKAVADAMGAEFDADEFAKELEVNLDPEFEYAVVKSRGEDRYTLGPVYMPDTLDAHGEWATAEDLEKASWGYFKSADHNVYLQHSEKKAGELVALMPWPNEVSATMQKAVDGVTKSVTTTFPAGTVYAGVLWEPWAWEMVKSNKITGFSMGGFSRRLEGSPVTV